MDLMAKITNHIVCSAAESYKMKKTAKAESKMPSKNDTKKLDCLVLQCLFK